MARLIGLHIFSCVRFCQDSFEVFSFVPALASKAKCLLRDCEGIAYTQILMQQREEIRVRVRERRLTFCCHMVNPQENAISGQLD